MRNPYNDKTYLNDFMAFELFENMGHYSVRRKYVEVFLDKETGRPSVVYRRRAYDYGLLSLDA